MPYIIRILLLTIAVPFVFTKIVLEAIASGLSEMWSYFKCYWSIEWKSAKEILNGSNSKCR